MKSLLDTVRNHGAVIDTHASNVRQLQSKAQDQQHQLDSNKQSSESNAARLLQMEEIIRGLQKGAEEQQHVIEALKQASLDQQGKLKAQEKQINSVGATVDAHSNQLA